MWIAGNKTSAVLPALLLCGTLMSVDTAFAQPPGKQPANDPLETPLPEGAIARLGTTRFRPGGMLGFLNLSHDGKRLITIGPGLGVWDTATGQLLRRLPGTAVCAEAELSRNGKQLLVNESVQHVSVLKIYELSSGKVVRVIEGARGRGLGGFAVAPDDRTVALEFVIFDRKLDNGTYLFKSQVELRDLKTDRVLHTFAEQRSFAPVTWLRFSPDGKTLYAISAISAPLDPAKDRSTISQFDCVKGTLKSQMHTRGMHYASPLISDGKSLIVLGTKMLDLDKGELRDIRPSKLEGGLRALLPGGKLGLVGMPAKMAAVQGRYGIDVREVSPAYLVLRDLEADRDIRRFPKRVPASHMVITPDGKSCIASTNVFGVLERWDLVTGEEIQPLDAPKDAPRTLVFSPDRKYLAALDMNNLHVWDRVTGKRIHHQALAQPRHLGLLRFTPDGKTLLFGGATQVLALNTATWKQTRHELTGLGLEAGSADMATAELSPDGKTLAVTVQNYRGDFPHWPHATLWDWASGKMTGMLKSTEQDLKEGGPGAFSADGKWLASLAFPVRGPNGERLVAPRVQIWGLANKKPVRDWQTTEPHLLFLEFSADGKSLMGGFHNGTVCVWDPATGKERVRFKHPHQPPTNMYVRFSPDGKRAATADYNGNLILFWDLATGKQVGQFRGHLGLTEGLVFSADGELLAVSGTDTAVLIVEVRRVVAKR